MGLLRKASTWNKNEHKQSSSVDSKLSLIHVLRGNTTNNVERCWKY